MTTDDFFDAWTQIQTAELAQQRPGRTWAEWKTQFAWQPADDLPPVDDREVYRASTTLAAGQLLPPARFILVEAWSAEPYRLVWTSFEDRVILTYAEGDLSYIYSATPQAATLARRGTWAFYRDLTS